MCRYLNIVLSILLSACATFSANKISQIDIHLSGGSYERNSWDDTLTFKRTSWYIDAYLAYDVLMTRLDKKSPFTYWLENSRESYMNGCKDFYVALIYGKMTSSTIELASSARIRNQISDLGFEEVSIAAFKDYLNANTVYNQWHFGHHKVLGYCYKKNDTPPKEIPISMPGFNTINILK